MIGAITAGFLGGAGAAVLGDYESLQTVTLASAQSSVDFTSIPSTYTHLQLRVMNLNSATSAAATILVGTGGTVDSSNANYKSHRLTGDGASATAGSFSGVPQNAWVTGNSNSSNPEILILDILDYTNTNKYKTSRMLSGVDNNGSGEINLTSSVWLNTGAINVIRLTVNTGNFNQYSSFALYGVK